MTLLRKLPESHQAIVTLVNEIAARTATAVFLVGGPVRDLFLDQPTLDLDFCVSENLEALASELGQRLDAPVHFNQRFLTASISTPSLRIDLAVQRRESYSAPGALPDVTPGTLAEDLQRRDFSLNAIAINLTSGDIVDPANGRHDLEQKLIRVLHQRSFIDDPTRIWRALRFSVRLDFEIETRTNELIREAVDQGSLQTVSSQRLRAELERAVREDLAGSLLVRLSQTGLTCSLFGPLDLERVSNAVEDADRASRIAPEADRSKLFVGALAVGMSDREGAARRLGFSSTIWQEVLELFPRADSIRKILTGTSADRETLELLNGVSPEVLALVSLDRADPTEFHRRWASFRGLDPGVRGDQLGVPPGPHIGRAIERTKAALFLGEIDKSEAVSFARNEALKYLSNQR